MRVMLQRVSRASVKVDNKVISRMTHGWLAFIGIAESDTKLLVDKMCRKILGLRCFADASGKSNLSILDVHGEILAISQFTLYANCKKGRRPSFISAAGPEKANSLYDYTGEVLEREIKVHKGIFAADMNVELENQGPYTIFLDSEELGIKPK
jgi:D-aminoacyl-tRNA deacylase